MTILLLNQTFYPDRVATAQQTLDLARYLSAEGWTVTVVTSRRAYDQKEKMFPKYEEFEGIRIHRVASTGLGKRTFLRRIIDAVSFDLALSWKLLTLPKQDVVISFTSPPLIGLFGTAFCLLRGGHSIQWLMDVNPDAAMETGHIRRDSFVGRGLSALLRFTLEHSRFVIVLDRWMKEKVSALGASAEKICVIPPWTVSQVVPAVDDREGNPFRTAHGLAGKFVVLFSGNHSVVHPMDTLLEAAVRLKDDPEIFFLFIGGGERVADVRAVVEKHQLKNVLQLPHQPREMLRYSLSAGDLHIVIMGNKVAGLVHTSKVYGVLGTGKPYLFIGPKRSHVGDLLNDCPYGFQVENGDIAGVIETIRKVKAFSRNEIEKFAEANTTYVRRHFTSSVLLARFTGEALDKLRTTPQSKSPPRPIAKAR